MDDGQSMDEIRYDLDKPRIAPYKNTWRPHQTKVFWCNVKLAQKKGLQFFLARSHAIVLYNTLPAICIEKAVCMKTKEELYHKVFQSPRLPRVKLKPNSKSGHQTTEAFRKLAETTSTFEFQAYLILQFNNWTRIAEKRSKSWFSSSRITRTRCSSCRTWRRPKRLIRSAKGGRSWSPTMGNTEIFELLRNVFQERMPRLCFIWGNRHRLLFIWKKSKTVAKDQTVGQEELWRLINSRLRHQKEPHPWCQTWSFRAATNFFKKTKEMLQKARQPKHGGCKTILERWHKDDKYLKSLSDIGWTEEQILQ